MPSFFADTICWSIALVLSFDAIRPFLTPRIAATLCRPLPSPFDFDSLRRPENTTAAVWISRGFRLSSISVSFFRRIADRWSRNIPGLRPCIPLPLKSTISSNSSSVNSASRWWLFLRCQVTSFSVQSHCLGRRCPPSSQVVWCSTRSRQAFSDRLMSPRLKWRLISA